MPVAFLALAILGEAESPFGEGKSIPQDGIDFPPERRILVHRPFFEEHPPLGFPHLLSGPYTCRSIRFGPLQQRPDGSRERTAARIREEKTLSKSSADVQGKDRN